MPADPVVRRTTTRETLFVMAGGGTGGHVLPLLAVARELRQRGHEVLFIGTKKGIEARLVPAAGFPLEFIEIGGMKGVGAVRLLRTLWSLPVSTLQVMKRLRELRPRGVFSMGGYAAGPTVAAALLQRIPVIAMEPNAAPGITNKLGGRYARRTLLTFPEAARFFPAGRTEVTGLPIRREFFEMAPRRRDSVLRLLITGGSAGSRTLNRAARESWPLFRAAGFPIHILHQTGRDAFEETRAAFAESGLAGEVVPFIDDMPAAYASSDLIVSRAGAGAVSEIAAAGRPSILVPYPYAADQHQLRNAEAFEKAGSARLALDKDLTGERLFELVRDVAGRLEAMGEAARKLAKPGAAERAADLLEELIDS